MTETTFEPSIQIHTLPPDATLYLASDGRPSWAFRRLLANAVTDLAAGSLPTTLRVGHYSASGYVRLATGQLRAVFTGTTEDELIFADGIAIALDDVVSLAVLR